MNDLVSIVVPVYNVEDYLDNCIRSIIAQTYSNLEVILVDDGSTDKSGEICDKYANQDNRITVYHKENGGLSSARNYGIERIRGTYVSFIDSDDSVNRNYIAALMEGCGSNDISVCSNRRISETDVIDWGEVYLSEKTELKPDEAIIRFFNDNIFVSAWGKMFPSAFFSDIRFPEGKIYEDYATIYKLYAKAKKIVYSEVQYYYYTIRTSSITGAPFSQRNLDMLDVIESTEVDLLRGAFGHNIIEAFWGSKAKCYLFLFHKISASCDAELYRNTQSHITDYIKAKKICILRSANVCMRIKLAVLIFAINKRVFGMVMNRLYG
ncbi:MAG: glycosyltransferase [Lachnospiraceae bacterium]|nr:glycosyltransferase [Lachnospiraceae bacterium]